MPRPTNQRIANMNGTAALPRKSGELVFHDLWERRVFALAVALSERGLYTWDEFRDHLITEIAAAEQNKETDAAHPPPEPGYYESWLAAFEKLLVEKGIRP
ncbi:MAG: nitrile hydratase accessory protein [Candidatus Binatia bacterium]